MTRAAALQPPRRYATCYVPMIVYAGTTSDAPELGVFRSPALIFDVFILMLHYTQVLLYAARYSPLAAHWDHVVQDIP